MDGRAHRSAGTAIADSGGVLSQDPAINTWLTLIQAEYREIPGLKLTKAQAQRLWGIDRAAADALLEALIASRFLAKTASEAYVLAEHR